jgi:hypothetical protein
MAPVVDPSMQNTPSLHLGFARADAVNKTVAGFILLLQEGKEKGKSDILFDNGARTMNFNKTHGSFCDT